MKTLFAVADFAKTILNSALADQDSRVESTQNTFQKTPVWQSLIRNENESFLELKKRDFMLRESSLHGSPIARRNFRPRSPSRSRLTKAFGEVTSTPGFYFHRGALEVCEHK